MAFLFFLLAVGGFSAGAQELKLRRGGFIGVAAAPVPDEVRDRLHLTGGVLVQSIIDGGTAQAAGLAANDIITEVNDQKVTGPDDFARLARALRAGDAATLTGFRNGQPLTKRIVVKPRPSEAGVDADVR